MGHIFKSDSEGGLSDPTQERLQCGSEQRKGASRIGVPEQATVFTPERIALPVPALTAPVGADLLGDRTVGDFL